MNLNSVARAATRAVTPAVAAVLAVCTGYTTDGAGKRQPTYAADQNVLADVQAVSAADLKQLDSLNVQPVQRVAYLSGNVQGLNRAEARGGDVLTMLGQTWLVVAVLETWDTPGWCKVALAEQVPA